MPKSNDGERVTIQNPNTGRDDTTVARVIYEPVRQAILDAVGDAGSLRFSELRAEVEKRTPPSMWEDASVGWYTTTVKLDLEAKGLIQRSGSPQVLMLST